MFKFTRAAAIAAVGALALAGCSAGGSGDGGSGGGSATGGTLTWGVIAEASTFAQKDMRWANESPYAQAVYDTLLRANTEGEIEPGLWLAQAFGGHVVVGDFEGYLHWISARDGRLIARSRAGSDPIRARPAVGDGLLYVYNQTGRLSAIRVD